MSTQLGGVTLPDPVLGPEGSAGELVPKGVLQPMADGTAVYDFVDTNRYRRTIEWHWLTESEFNTILARAQVSFVQAFSPPETASTIQVVVTDFKWQTQQIPAGTYYHCQMKLIGVGD